MEERVQRFLDRLNEESERKEESLRGITDQKERLKREHELIRLGLCEREEAEKLPAPFEEGEWRWDAQKEVYFRYRSLDLTDEE